MNKHILQNSDNYRNGYSHNTHEIFIKYVSIINEYITQYTENIKIKIANPSYYIYVFNKGIETLSHIFKIILLYTKNLNITYTQCQKAVYYYIEFMCQIGESTHTFLQLNSKDATLFVYKKTIFELNNEIIKDFNPEIDTDSITVNIRLLTDIYNKTILAITNNCNYKNITLCKTTLVQGIMPHITELSKNLLNISLDCTDINYEKKIYTTKVFNNYIYLIQDYSPKFILEFSKQIKKKYVDNNILKNKLNSEDNGIYLKEWDYKKYIDWLINTK